MNFDHATMSPPTRNERLGGLARDLLRVVWDRPGITSAALWRRLGRSSWDDQVALTMRRLRERDLVEGFLVSTSHGDVNQWSIKDADAVRELLQLPAKAPEGRGRPYTEQFANPDFGLSDRLAAMTNEARNWQGEIVGGRQIEPDFNAPPAPRPVVRRGSLDALRVPSLMFGQRHGSDPCDRLAVVEARTDDGEQP